MVDDAPLPDESEPGPTEGGVRFGRALDVADRATTFVERPVRRLGGSARLNPLPHAGTISVFLLGVVVFSGLYVTLFFEFGHAASYDSVARIEDHVIQRVVRALHRYSSAALVLTTLVHAWRIFVNRRFIGPRRRWRWASGVTALTLVWLAGVTGYWLVWDRRAAAINEALAALLEPFAAGSRFAVRHLLGVSGGSGSGFLLLIWFAHLALTALIGWFMFRHLRRSRLPWLPPNRWMLIMGTALLLVSVVAPVGMLGPARPDQLVADMPLDPFVLFLLPPLLTGGRWVALAAMLLGPLLVALLPRLLRQTDPDVIVVDADACTGCELCVIDCPYDALSLDTTAGRGLAVLEADQCVACGICVGSCAFDAIELPGSSVAMLPPRLDGHEVVVVCDRHPVGELAAPNTHVVPVRCAGMFAPGAVRSCHDRGATAVHLIGCAPDECRYGTGNQLAVERLAGERAPHPPRTLAARIATDLVHREDVAASRKHPGVATHQSDGRRELVAPALFALVSIAVVVAATGAPFRSGDDGAGLRVVVDHESGAQLADAVAAPGVLDTIEVSVDEQIRARRQIGGDDDTSVGFVDWELPPRASQLTVTASGPNDTIVLFDDRVDPAPGSRIVLTAFDVPAAPGSKQGREVFDSRAAGCTVCHSTRESDDGVGPSLYGVADVAGSRVEGLNAELYLRQSILLPDQYIVDGWPAGQMLPIYRERLTEQDLDALLTYLLTLTAEPTS